MGHLRTPPAAHSAAVERYANLGTALVALAFAVPAVATLSGEADGSGFLQTVGTTLGFWLALAFAAWVATRKRSNLAQAKARTVVGIVVCLAVGTEFMAGATEGTLAAPFVQDAVDFQHRHAAKFEELGRRFEQVTVTQHLTAAGLASPQSVSAGLAELERYRALLAERKLLLQTYLSEYVAFLKTLPPGEARLGAESAIAASKQVTEDLYKTLDRAQTAHAAAMGAIFSWAQAHAGTLALRGERLLFSTQRDRNEFALLSLRLQQTELAIAGAVDKAQIDGVRAAARLEQSMRRAQALLSK